jgi:hypothetical protein
MICPDDLTTGLETAFTRIRRERMTNVPLLNPALEVQAAAVATAAAMPAGVAHPCAGYELQVR